MIVEEVSQYIYDKNIPLKFIYENNYEYTIYITTGTHITNWYYVFPLMDEHKSIPKIIFTNMNSYMNDKIFNLGNPSFEYCLSEFLFWWEINKSRCKSITYYEN